MRPSAPTRSPRLAPHRRAADPRRRTVAAVADFEDGAWVNVPWLW